MSQQPQTMNITSWSLLIFLSVLWGSSFFLTGVAVRELPPLTVVLARVGLAALLLLPFFWYHGHRLPTTLKDWVPFIGMGLTNNVIPFSCIFFGQTYITSGLASIINAMTPLFTVLVMASFLEEKLTTIRVVGVLLGVMGVGIIQGFDIDLDQGQTIGILLCLVASLSYGFSALWARRKLIAVPPLKSATCQLMSSSLIMCVVVSFIDQPWTLEMPSVKIWFAIIGIGSFGTALAYIVFYRIIKNAGSSNVMLVTLLVPITALLLGATFLSEPIHAQEIVGALVIGCGLLFIDGRLFNVFRRNKPQAH